MLDYDYDHDDGRCDEHQGTPTQTAKLLEVQIVGSLVWLVVNVSLSYHMIMKNPFKDNLRLSQIMQYILTLFNIYHLILLLLSLPSFNNENENENEKKSIINGFVDDHHHHHYYYHGMVFFQLAHSHLAYIFMKISALFTGLVILMILHELTIKKKKKRSSSLQSSSSSSQSSPTKTKNFVGVEQQQSSTTTTKNTKPTTTSTSTTTTYNSPLSKRKTTKWLPACPWRWFA